MCRCVVQQQNIITSQGPGTAIEFGLAVLSAMGSVQGSLTDPEVRSVLTASQITDFTTDLLRYQKRAREVAEPMMLASGCWLPTD